MRVQAVHWVTVEDVVVGVVRLVAPDQRDGMVVASVPVDCPDDKASECCIIVRLEKVVTLQIIVVQGSALQQHLGLPHSAQASRVLLHKVAAGFEVDQPLVLSRVQRLLHLFDKSFCVWLALRQLGDAVEEASGDAVLRFIRTSLEQDDVAVELLRGRRHDSTCCNAS